MVNKKDFAYYRRFCFSYSNVIYFFSGWENLISLVKMEDKIIFSGPVFMLFF